MSLILVINPGSTSTKIAVYDDTRRVMMRNLVHTSEELAAFERIIDQLPFRQKAVSEALTESRLTDCFDIVMSRGGLLRPIESGVYEVNALMLEHTYRPMLYHACNMGALIAHNMAEASGCKAYIADPGVVDELDEIARITGMPMIRRHPVWHALNQRAIARRYAAELGTCYEDATLIGCHMGGGISVALHRKGRVVEANNALDGEGTFSPERSGTLPAGELVSLCFSGDFTEKQIRMMLAGRGGLTALLGTNDVREIERRISDGDDNAKLMLDAMIYQTARQIGAAAASACGEVEGIFLTGGVAHSDYVVSELTRRISFIAPVAIYAGEDEMEALAQNALSLIAGEIAPKAYL